jgi:hypothetical protein
MGIDELISFNAVLSGSNSPKDSCGSMRIFTDEISIVEAGPFISCSLRCYNGAMLDNERRMSQGTYLNMSLHELSHNVQHWVFALSPRISIVIVCSDAKQGSYDGFTKPLKNLLWRRYREEARMYHVRSFCSGRFASQFFLLSSPLINSPSLLEGTNLCILCHAMETYSLVNAEQCIFL